MKIITWNCNMAFRKKAGYILKHKPDILIIPECEHPDKLIFPSEVSKPTDIVWHGANPHKGIGIFSYGKYKLSLLDHHNPELKLILPIVVTGGADDLTLYAIWANNPNDPDGVYVEQVWKALKYYDALLKDKQTILAGDFNSNTIWDRKRREGNHTNVVKVLESKGIFSSYHLFYKQKQGKEKHPTQYMYRHKDKSYHLDYCFVSADLVKRIKSVEIGDYEYWTQFSDHVPVMVTFTPARKRKILKNLE